MWVYELILIPNPPPMSWERKSNWSTPTPIDGAITNAPKRGKELFETTRMMSVPGSQLISIALHSMGVDE